MGAFEKNTKTADDDCNAKSGILFWDGKFFTGRFSRQPFSEHRRLELSLGNHPDISVHAIGAEIALQVDQSDDRQTQANHKACNREESNNGCFVTRKMKLHG
ncbi:MAG TPA: hypothetical protein VEZ24_05080 [Microvirga sp.]|nr:hypothetical protein [Microvirga sp.]